MNVLGLSAFYHDSAAAVLKDGVLVAAAQEERFTRKKHDESMPAGAIDYCLREAGLAVADLDVVAFYDKPLLKFERLLSTYAAFAPKGFGSFRRAMGAWLTGKLWTRDEILEGLPGFRGRVVFAEHHESHAASAFYPSPFEDAAVLTMDGVGEWATSSVGLGRGRGLELLEEMRFPHSLGLLYSAFTYYTGFRVNSGEYKVMGLAPYGEPKYKDLILRELVDLKEDGSFKLDMRYFDYCAGDRMTNRAFDALFGGPPRAPESPLGQREKDLARSIQEVCEEIMLRMARHARAVTGSRNLCLAGGVALNCVGNGRLLRESGFDAVWPQPASGDAGGALGAALLAHHKILGNDRRPRLPDSQRASLLGPAYSDAEIEAALKAAGAVYERVPDADLPRRAAERIAAGEVVGWFQGRMEFGPRALGARSILGDPRDPGMRSRMNLKIKFREGFRPFAPAVLAERAAEWFELPVESPYMMLTAPVKPGREIPAVTHVDGSARVQTVSERDNPLFHGVLRAFEEKTGCPVVINTSFNVRGEPIVCRPEEAYAGLQRTGMDSLFIGPFLMLKKDQPAPKAPHREFAPD